MISPSTFSPTMHSNFSISSNTNNPTNSPISQHGKETKKPEDQTQQSEAKDTSTGTPKTQELSDSDRRHVEELQTRDREVRAHEAAHKAAAGSLARGAASFTYKQGPDGRRYAVGGEVSIETSPVNGDPQATLQKAQTIRAAALAPAQPSNTDHAVAAKANQMAASARAEIAAETQKNTKGAGKTEQDDDQNNDQNVLTQQGLSTKNGANLYQRSVNPTAPSDLIGNNLNTTA